MPERRSRFAPSPTGPLHLGNLQTGLAAWLQARLANALFILRIEDLDRPRCRPAYADGIAEDLRWLGIDWDVGPGRSPAVDYRQGARNDIYHAALTRLAERGDLFPCACSRRDLAELASAPHGPLGPVYPGTCRDRRIQAADFKAPGRDAFRFRCRPGIRAVEDRLQGDVHCDMAHEVGDFVVFRRDGVIAYHLAVVADDIEMGVTDVLRGEDLLWSVFPQLELYDAFDAESPAYWHVPLRRDAAGRRMAKRLGGVTLQSLRSRGESPETVTGALAFGLGLIDREEPTSAQDLLGHLDETTFQVRIRSRIASDPGAVR